MSISVATPSFQCRMCLAPYALATGKHNTCRMCCQFMDHGVICIGIKDGTGGIRDLLQADLERRDGNWCVLTVERAQALLGQDVPGGYTVIRTTKWKELGLPVRGKSGAAHASRVDDKRKRVARAD